MANLIENKLTPLTEAEATYALREGWKLNFGEYPSLDSLSILWAQSALESARWSRLHCYNFANIKRFGDHDYCMYRCGEIINGKQQIFVPPHPQTMFCAYASMVDGAKEYIEFVSRRPRYKDAWTQVIAGSPIKYCAALRIAGYFTADLVQYTKGVVSLCDEFKKKSATLLSYSPPEAVALVAPTPIEEPIQESVAIPEPIEQTPAPSEQTDNVWNRFVNLFKH